MYNFNKYYSGPLSVQNIPWNNRGGSIRLLLDFGGKTQRLSTGLYQTICISIPTDQLIGMEQGTLEAQSLYINPARQPTDLDMSSSGYFVWPGINNAFILFLLCFLLFAGICTTLINIWTFLIDQRPPADGEIRE